MAAAAPDNVVPIKGVTRSASTRTLNQAAKSSTSTTVIPAQAGGGGTGGLGDWATSVETRLGELRSDVRNLLIAGGVVALALAGAGWKAYDYATEQMRQISVSQQQIAGKIETLDAKVAGRLDLMEERLRNESQGSDTKG